MSTIDNTKSHAVTTKSVPVPGELNELSNPAAKVPNGISNPEDAPTSYKLNSATEADLDVQEFLKGFAQSNHVYGLIKNLNNTLKGLFREMRESEAKTRINEYISSFETALEKRDEVIKAADEVKKLGYEAANWKLAMGATESALGFVSAFSGGSSGGGGGSGIVSGGMKMAESVIKKIEIEIENIKMLLEARKTELDADMTFDKQQADLANAAISMLDGLTSSISSLINEIHNTQSSAINAMAKGMV
ncbi:hypothetical protein TDB9533_04596 [Thalassocella blandensis]|nr:hypothetical protein TDB9533_04596 [Thalassocella blandensis]